VKYWITVIEMNPCGIPPKEKCPFGGAATLKYEI